MKLINGLNDASDRVLKNKQERLYYVIFALIITLERNTYTHIKDVFSEVALVNRFV